MDSKDDTRDQGAQAKITELRSRDSATNLSMRRLVEGTISAGLQFEDVRESDSFFFFLQIDSSRD